MNAREEVSHVAVPVIAVVWIWCQGPMPHAAGTSQLTTMSLFTESRPTAPGASISYVMKVRGFPPLALAAIPRHLCLQTLKLHLHAASDARGLAWPESQGFGLAGAGLGLRFFRPKPKPASRAWPGLARA
ncbi:hypothetical protein FB451DRAFT_1182609 [Mycena latifolia]|nr:hypothetical protein FB451DRAFT_1182609 [Mycena latifolia]